jgi:predicted dehydrogenase
MNQSTSDAVTNRDHKPSASAMPTEQLNQQTADSLDRRMFLAGSLALPLGINGLPTCSLASPPARPHAHAQEPAPNGNGGKPLRLGLISAASYGLPGAVRTSGSHHGTAFATIFNGWDEDLAAQYEGTFVKSATRLPGAEVVKVWDPLPTAAAKLAAACRIPEVCPTPEACSADVDAVILIDDGSGQQWRFAQHPLQLGVPVFCDKPLAMTAAEAQQVAGWAQASGTKLMSASSLRFVPDIVRMREEIESLGTIQLAIATGPGQLVYYGIHALSMVYAVLGGGVRSVWNIGRAGRHCLQLSYHERELETLLMVTEAAQFPMGYQLQLFGDRGSRTITPDLTDLYVYLLRAFLEYLSTGTAPFPLEDEVELIAALEAGQRSLDESRRVELAELLQRPTP